MQPASTDPQRSTARLPFPPPGGGDEHVIAARRVNAAFAAGRHLAERRLAPDPIERLERRCEALEAAVYALTLRLGDAEREAA